MNKHADFKLIMKLVFGVIIILLLVTLGPKIWKAAKLGMDALMGNVNSDTQLRENAMGDMRKNLKGCVDLYKDKTQDEFTFCQTLIIKGIYVERADVLQAVNIAGLPLAGIDFNKAGCMKFGWYKGTKAGLIITDCSKDLQAKYKEYVS